MDEDAKLILKKAGALMLTPPFDECLRNGCAVEAERFLFT